MEWKPVRAGRDHLQQYGRQPAVDAVAELVWNALDAEADEVDVEIETASVGEGDRALAHVTRIVVSDNGHGITPDLAERAFLSLGDSWKKSLHGRTLNNKRALHGNRGRGRFLVYALGHRATWSSVSIVDDAATLVELRGDQNKIDGFIISEPKPTAGPTGTTVTVTVEQGRSLTALLRDDLHLQLAARLAPPLLVNADILVTVNGTRLDPAALIRGEAVDMAAQQVGSQMTQISADLCRELLAMGAAHGSKIRSTSTRGGAGRGPSRLPSGERWLTRSWTSARRTHARATRKKTDVLIRGQRAHQHSPLRTEPPICTSRVTIAATVPGSMWSGSVPGTERADPGRLLTGPMS